MTKPLAPHPERIVPSLPMHARAPAREPGEPVDEALLAEDAFYGTQIREAAAAAARRGRAWAPLAALTLAGLAIALLLRGR